MRYQNVVLCLLFNAQHIAQKEMYETWIDAFEID